MGAVVEVWSVDSAEEGVPTDGLFTVWFDLHFGEPPADWWWEVPGPQPLAAALELAADLRSRGWVCQVMPEGQNPRADGRWDNP